MLSGPGIKSLLYVDDVVLLASLTDDLLAWDGLFSFQAAAASVIWVSLSS